MVVHVVDNASTDGTAEMIRDEFPEVELQTLPWNAGFCIANNVVLRRATARYVLLLNPDTEVTPGRARPHGPPDGRAPRHRHGQLPAGAARRHLRPRGQALVPHAAGRAGPLHRDRPAHRGRRPPRPVPRARARRARQRRGRRRQRRVHARARPALEQVGPLDEGYWLYMDDLDWCYRFKQAGWKVWYDGSVTCIHVKGGTTVEARRSGRHRGLKHNLAFHRSMGRFYRKFYAGRAPARGRVIYAAIMGEVPHRRGAQHDRAPEAPLVALRRGVSRDRRELPPARHPRACLSLAPRGARAHRGGHRADRGGQRLRRRLLRPSSASWRPTRSSSRCPRTSVPDRGERGAPPRRRGEWVLLINNDVEVEPDAVAHMLAAARLGPRRRLGGRPDALRQRRETINSAGIGVDRLGIAFDRLLGEPLAASETEPVEVFGACGGAALYRRAMLDADRRLRRVVLLRPRRRRRGLARPDAAAGAASTRRPRSCTTTTAPRSGTARASSTSTWASTGCARWPRTPTPACCAATGWRWSATTSPMWPRRRHDRTLGPAARPRAGTARVAHLPRGAAPGAGRWTPTAGPARRARAAGRLAPALRRAAARRRPPSPVRAGR